jgi:methionyl aminopeptidase
MSIQSEKDLLALARVGNVVGLTLNEMKRALKPGMTTGELDAIALNVLERHGARSAPQLFYGFPGVTCISVNDEAVHGIPGNRVLQPGDVVKMDVTAELDGYIADAAVTVVLAPASSRKQKLAASAEAAFQKALDVARTGSRVYEIGRAIETEVKRQGFTVLRELSSHGVGRHIHEEPTIPNYEDRRANRRLTEGLIITVEPIIAAGSDGVETAADGWTEKTVDGSLSAHFEHTIVITRGRPIILTAA